MSLTVAMITVDSIDALALGRWWAERLGGAVVEENDGWFVIVSVPDAPVQLAFQKVERPTPGKNKVHLDLTVEDLDAEVKRLEAAGADQVSDHTVESGFRWVTFADPEGNYFDVAQAES
ncbi:VOC family protein [Mumia zhuanghuii]|uniref:VOC family protein n=1 Tax=Mumia zhuanghuii TaxID=2585211 RepID=A0A5C4N084_9ACTN|nr:VOC family protein [Mumia zhuanghuii]TNC47555.1 VOC family protein [Mumia zhuanghuii]TNC50271.1 VOC family protein [Mumia zhuanghuii]